MLPEISYAFALLALCVVIHAAGLTWIAQMVTTAFEGNFSGRWAASWLLIRTVWALAALHILEIILWAFFFHWQDCLPNLETCTYFSGVSYTTIGYGDVLLPKRWWFLGPMEGLTGILMCGLSTGFFFMVVSRLFAAKQPASAAVLSPDPQPPPPAP